MKFIIQILIQYLVVLDQKLIKSIFSNNSQITEYIRIKEMTACLKLDSCSFYPLPMEMSCESAYKICRYKDIPRWLLLFHLVKNLD